MPNCVGAPVPTGNSELLEIMELARLAATLFRCLSYQLSSPFFGLPSTPRVALELENFALRHQLNVRPKTSLDAGRSFFVGRPVARLAKLARGTGHRSAGDRYRVASPGKCAAANQVDRRSLARSAI
jgi:hypothetical protein